MNVTPEDLMYIEALPAEDVKAIVITAISKDASPLIMILSAESVKEIVLNVLNEKNVKQGAGEGL